MEYSFDYLQTLISMRTSENQELEFKDGRAIGDTHKQKLEVTKDISAFANAGGGILIYGVTESPNPGGAAEKLSPVDRRAFSPEWLEQLASQISPRISGLKIHPISIDQTEATCCYVLEIPGGDTAHQALDFRYYRRYNFQAVPMVDYEIRDVMNRSKHPAINAMICGFEKRGRPQIIVEFENIGRVMARYYSARVHFPAAFMGRPFKPQDATYVGADSGAYWEFQIANGIGAPLFPRAKVSRGISCDWLPAFPANRESAENIHMWLYADSMQPIHLIKENIPGNLR
jgi:hypothetical protein